MEKKEYKDATLTDWAVVQYPEIYDALLISDDVSSIYVDVHSNYTRAIFGRASKDIRHNHRKRFIGERF